jgi:hypothetical protein
MVPDYRVSPLFLQVRDGGIGQFLPVNCRRRFLWLETQSVPMIHHLAGDANVP